MPTPASYVPLIITELGGRERPIILYGSLKPKRASAITLGVHIRGVERWYPGSSVPTSQVLGPQWPTLTFSGMFEDRKIRLPTGALLTVLYIEQIVKAGRPCRLIYGAFIRECRWVRFDYSPKEFQRITYEIELQPINDGLGKIKKRIKEGLRTAPDTESPIESTELAMEKILELEPSAERDATFESMQKVLEFEVEGETIIQKGEVITRERATAALAKYESAGDRMREAYNRATAIVHKPGPDPSILLPNALQTGSVRTTILHSSSLLQQTTQKTAQLAGLARRGVVYIASQGDSLHKIAQKFYGSSSKWSTILETNGLTSPAINPGQELVLPDVPEKDLKVNL